MAANYLNFGKESTESPAQQAILGADPELQQKWAMARLLLQQSPKPIKYWHDAIPNATNQIMGALLGRQAGDELKTQTGKYQTDMASMLAGGQEASWTDPDTGAAKKYGGGYQGMIDAGIKTGNPALQSTVQAIQLKQAENQSALTQAREVAKLKAQLKAAEPQKFLAGQGLRDPVTNEVTFQMPFNGISPYQQGQLDLGQQRIDASAANRRPQPETFEPMRAEEVAAEGLAPGGVYRKGNRGNIKTVQKSVVGTEKVLPMTYANKLMEKGELVDTGGRLNEGFKDEFGGHTFAGDWSNTFKRVTGDDTGQGQWWQDYQYHTNEVRNKLFGSALTPTESMQWDRANIDPRMDAAEIRKNLKRRQEIEARGLERLMRGTAAGGYNKAQIEEFAGRAIPGPSPSTPMNNQSTPTPASPPGELNPMIPKVGKGLYVGEKDGLKIFSDTKTGNQYFQMPNGDWHKVIEPIKF
jgi:hypothetical protein